MSKSCFSPYSAANEEKRHFLHDWNNPLESWEMFDNESDPSFLYIDDSNMEVTFVGRLSKYSLTGYKADMGESKQVAETTIKHLQSKNWLDRFTKVLLIEAILYNANVNLFTTVKIVIEIPDTGGFLFMHDVQSQRLYNYIGQTGVVLMILKVVWALCILNSTWKVVNRIICEKIMFFKQFLNLFDIFDITTAIFAIVALVLKVHFTILGIENVHQSKGRCSCLTVK